MDLFSFKELYDCYLKTTYLIETDGRTFEEGETIAKFDKIQIAGLQELTERITANGGFDNRPHVFWETTRAIDLAFSQGVFSKHHFALISNSKIISINKGDTILISKTEEKESNESGVFYLEELPVGKFFVYDKENGEKIKYSQNEKEITIDTPYLNVIIIYNYNYTGGASQVSIGRRYISGYLSFEGKTRLKDDKNGQVTTGLVKIPKLKLMSDLSIRLGTQANPIIANFMAQGIPTGVKGNSYVTEFLFLNNDVDSDL